MLFKKFIIGAATFLASLIAPFSVYASYHRDCFEFPVLTGNYTVSKTVRHVIDISRQEPFNPTEKRELMLHIWYPTHRGEVHPLIPYRLDEISETKEKMLKMGFPEEDLNNLDVVYSHAPWDEKPWEFGVSFPLILFSHGYLASPLDYTAFCEELASHGFVVASVAHTYYTQQVVFPDGRKITAAPELYTCPTVPNKDVQKLWTLDVQCALSYLAQCNTLKHDPFYNFLDLDRVGVIGHSMGGATAYTLCTQDQRFKAGMSLDAAFWITDPHISTLNKSFLCIFAEESIKGLQLSVQEIAQKYGVEASYMQEFRDLSQQVVRADVVIPDILHSGFSDLLFLKELPVYKNNKHIFDLEAMTGTAEGKKTIQLINKHIVDFFNQCLKYT